MQWRMKEINNSGSVTNHNVPLERRPYVAREPTQVLCRGPYIVRECEWRGVVGIGAYRQVRGRGISASFVAPWEIPAACCGASVHAVLLGAPHAVEPVQAKDVCHQNRHAWVKILHLPQALLLFRLWNWLSSATAATRHVHHAPACESTKLDALSNRSRAHWHRVGRCGHREPQRLRYSGHQVL